VDVSSHLGRPIHERTVSLPYSTFDEKLIELPLKFLCLRQNEKAAHFCVETLGNVKRESEVKADLMKDVLHGVIHSRVNRYTWRLVYNDKAIVLISDRGLPIDGLYGESLRLQMYANILPRRENPIRTDSFALQIDGSK
jgi:hypothetical protein